MQVNYTQFKYRGKVAVLGAAAIILTAPCVVSPAVAAENRSNHTQSNQPRLRLRIAVDQFKWNEIRDEYSNVPRDVREGLQALLIEKLHASGHFQVFEREATAREQARQEDEIDQRKRASLPAGTVQSRQARTPAQYIITPTVVGFQETESGKGDVKIGPVRVQRGKKKVTLTLNIRISDAETSSTLETQTATGSAETKSGGMSASLKGWDFRDSQTKSSPIGKCVADALDKAVSQIVDRLSKESWYAKVATYDARTGRVVINAGTDSGVTQGMEFFVYKSSGQVIDPDTGDIISHGDETVIGRIRVERVERAAAFAKVLSGNGFTTRNIVRLK